MLAEPERIARILRSLPDAPLRTAFLRDFLATRPLDQAARTLDALCSARVRDPKEPLLAVVALLAHLHDDPILEQLGRESAALALPNLGRLLRRAPEVASHLDDPPARTPDYGRGRELSLGERKFLARRPSRSAFDKLLRDPHPQVIAQLLVNPRLTEDDVVRLAARRPAAVDALRMIAKTGWLMRPRVRLALIHNPGTPSAIAVPLVALCTVPELREVIGNADCSPVLQSVAAEFSSARSIPPES